MMPTIQFHAMGCEMQAILDGEPPRADQRLASVPGWFETWEDCFSRFRPDSELSRLNQQNGQPWRASLDLWSVFQAALLAEQDSQGLVTPCVLPALIQAGYDRSFDTLEQAPMTASTLDDGIGNPVGSIRSIAWDAATQTIDLPEGMALDFGGLAKGWAAQHAVKKLRAYGPALVDAGGDVAVSGLQQDGQPWLIGIADPFAPDQNLGVLKLSGGGVATSGTDYRRWVKNGAWKHHIIDPRTGRPAETDILSATVVAPSVLEAEMAAKVMLILGSQAGLEWLETKPGFEALLVLYTQQNLSSRNFRHYLIPEG